MGQSAKTNSSREIALARRRAMSAGGKAGLPQSQQQATRSAPVKAEDSAPAQPSAPAATRTKSARRVSAGANASSSTARAAALARRKAMSTRGKQAVSSTDRVRKLENVPKAAAAAPAPRKDKGDCGCGCGGKGDCGDKGRAEKSASEAPKRASGNGSARASRARTARKPAIVQSSAKAASLARRKAQSTRGKAGLSAGGMSEAQTARAANPGLTSRELSRALREQRSSRGKTCTGGKCRPTGKVRKKKEFSGAAQDASWKVGASETGRGQTVTGTMVGRDRAVTGDEASTCRDITGTEYLGADIFREFCQAEPASKPQRSGQTSTARGSSVTGNKVGRSSKVTGDEPGTCKNITGSEYVSAEQSEAFCGARPEPTPSRVAASETRKGEIVTGNQVDHKAKVTGGEAGASRELTGTQYTNVSEAGGPAKAAPAKVGSSKTLRGGSVTGTLVGRRERMTGDEAGSCRNITGDDYVGEEQFTAFCDTKPEPKDRKVGVSQTFGGKTVSGTLTGRSGRVTGDEPGTCQAITGTPYAGIENYRNNCEAEDYFGSDTRMRPNRRTFGAPMTGKQPSVGGKTTGDKKGACESVSGTPYVGADQAAEACPAIPAEPGSSDFPQPVEGAPGKAFSVEAPSHAAQQPGRTNQVTGAQYEQGHITGPFGKAGGKVTGTEEARFGPGRSAAPPALETAAEIDGRIKSRITGEGQDAGHKITGDDWDRGDRVTGTEGASATQRNTTLRGAPMSAMGARAVQPAEAPEPVSKVTGSSGNTERGSMITYSGGARG